MINDNGDQNTSRNQSTQVTDAARKPRGFAAMEPSLVSELARRGGKAAHRAGTAHQFTSDEARIAGRKGGMATHATGRTSGAQLKPS
jgi:general stress protein YciG